MNETPAVETEPLTTADEALVERARETTERAFDPGRFGGAHMVGAAVRTTDGSVFTGVSLPSSVGRTSMCAEPIALGRAIAEGATGFEACVAVRHPLVDEPDEEFRVVSACGACRELLCDYGEGIEIIIPLDEGLGKARTIDLLPTRHW